MEPHQERVVQEKKELDLKLSMLDDFLDSESFVNLDGEEQYRLRKQAQAMQDYSDILRDRIAAFK